MARKRREDRIKDYFQIKCLKTRLQLNYLNLSLSSEIFSFSSFHAISLVNVLIFSCFSLSISLANSGSMPNSCSKQQIEITLRARVLLFRIIPRQETT